MSQTGISGTTHQPAMSLPAKMPPTTQLPFPMQISTDADIKQLLTDHTPLIDVRAPDEFKRGAFPAAVNLPILDDTQRQQVGIAYKKQGPASATELGHSLVSGEIRDARIHAWRDFAANNPKAALYCFRGGQRSAIACEWLQAAGTTVPRIAGGYKRMRQLLLNELEQVGPVMLVSGQTGCGKTAFLTEFQRTLDLEAHAGHRGSAFGATLAGQPSQIDFENALAIGLMRLGNKAPILMEDESRLIGRIHLPPVFQACMAKASLVVISEPVAARAAHIHDEYIVQQWAEYQQHLGQAAFGAFRDYLLGAVDAIRRRLGNVEHGAVREQVEDALLAQQKGDLTPHLAWIEHLLAVYYDPMYSYQLGKKRDRVVFEGSRPEVAAWLRDNCPALMRTD